MLQLRVASLSLVLVAMTFFAARAAMQTPLVASAAPASTPTYGAVDFRIKVPRAPATHRALGLHRIGPRYISVSTQSFAVLTDGENPIVVAVDPLTGYAEVRFRVAAGMHTFTVIACDRPNAGGNVLSTGTAAPVDVTPASTVKVYLTLGGVVTSVALALAQLHPTIGSPVTIALEVVAKDADGNVMLAGTPFARPFTLTSSDPVNATLSQTTTAQAVEYVGVAFSGGDVSRITFSATGPGLQTVVPAVLSPLSLPATGEQLFVTGGLGVNAAVSTSTLQLLSTFGLSVDDGAPAFDPATHLLYVADGAFRPQVDIFQTSGSYARVGSFPTPFMNFISSIAVDSAARKVYLSDIESGQLWVYATTGDRLYDFTIGLYRAKLALDPSSQRLYAVACGGGNSCGEGGLRVYSTVSPYNLLGYFEANLGGVAVDSVAKRLYVLEYQPYYDPPTSAYIDVYDSLTLKLITRAGPLSSSIGAIALDTAARRLYAISAQPAGWPNESTIAAYGIDTNLSFLGSFFAPTAGYNIAVGSLGSASSLRTGSRARNH